MSTVAGGAGPCQTQELLLGPCHPRGRSRLNSISNFGSAQSQTLWAFGDQTRGWEISFARVCTPQFSEKGTENLKISVKYICCLKYQKDLPYDSRLHCVLWVKLHSTFPTSSLTGSISERSCGLPRSPDLEKKCPRSRPDGQEPRETGQLLAASDKVQKKA